MTLSVSPEVGEEALALLWCHVVDDVVEDIQKGLFGWRVLPGVGDG